MKQNIKQYENRYRDVVVFIFRKWEKGTKL
ncbi:hypothetical protein IMSAGC013_03434 [Lachnospiraceae bacterium]|jgi:hypothetical protein|nr:hypothetical protein IMSAGC013_03434 [Lachnospiraceae bacterium]